MMMRPVVDGQRANEAKISSSQEKGAKPSSFNLKAVLTTINVRLRLYFTKSALLIGSHQLPLDIKSG